MISVVIPCYNSSNTIASSVESVLNQSVDCQVEILVVDDCSSDFQELKDIIDNIDNASVNLKVLASPINGGGGHARNIGISAATGEYICFLDSDDEWFPNKLRVQLDNYQEGEILTSQVKKGPSVGESIVLPKLVKLENESISDALFVSNKLIQTSTFFMSSDIARDVLFNPDLPRHQDYDFLLRAESKGYKVIQMEKTLSFWRVEDESSGRFLKKKATPEFFIEWYKEYKKYMTDKAAIAYVARNIFSACVITRKFSLFSKFYLGRNFNIAERAKIAIGIIHWRIKKIIK